MRSLLEWAAAAFIVGVLVLSLAGCSNGTRFQSCQEARDAGASLPLHQGDPGWNSKLDRDHNGLACE
jgi:hypothetical protein